MKNMIGITSVTLAAMLAVTAFDANAAYAAKRMKKFLPVEEFDLNGNGEITADELQQSLQNKFEELDADNNGVITLDDLPNILPLSEAQEERRQMRLERIQKRLEERGIEVDEDNLAERGLPTRVRFMARHDKNADEQVSFEEFSRPAERIFSRVDADENGTITEEEIKAAKQKARKMRRLRKRARAAAEG